MCAGLHRRNAFHFLAEFFDKLVIDAFFNDDARSQSYRSTLVHEVGECCCIDGVINISIIEHDDRVLAPFQGKALASRCGSSAHLPADAAGTGEGDKLNAGIGNQAIAQFGTLCWDGIDNTGRKACICQ